MFYDAWMVLEGYVECLLGLTGFNGLWPCEVSTGLWFLSLGLTGFEWLGQRNQSFLKQDFFVIHQALNT